MRQYEGQRLHQVRRDPQQDLALFQRLADHAELAVFQVAQPAMDELGARAGRVRSQVVLFAQGDLQPASRRVAGDPGSIDPPAHHQHVEHLRSPSGRHLPSLGPSLAHCGWRKRGMRTVTRAR